MLQMAETIEPSTSTLRIGLLLNEAFDFFALADARFQRENPEDSAQRI